MYRCPKHGDDCRILIAGVMVDVQLYDDGAEVVQGDLEWEDTYKARCSDGWEGTVGQLIEIEDEV